MRQTQMRGRRGGIVPHGLLELARCVGVRALGQFEPPEFNEYRCLVGVAEQGLALFLVGGRRLAELLELLLYPLPLKSGDTA